MKKTKEINRLTSYFSYLNSQSELGKIIEQAKITCDNNLNYEKSSDYSENYSNINTSLAYYISNFINGRSKLLPTFDYIYDIEKNSDNNLISMGYGVSVLKNLKIECFSMITERRERVDKISSDDHIAFFIGSGRIYDDKEVGIIDIEERPVFDKKRVSTLQNYMIHYQEYKNNIKVKVRK